MTIRDIAVAFGFEVDRSSEKEAQNSIKGIKNLATKLLGSVAVVFSVKGMADLAQAAADAEALKSQFTQVFGEMEEEASSSLNKISKDTGVAVNRMKGSFTQIAAFSKTTGVEQAEALDIAKRAMVAITDSAAFYDRSIEEVTESMRSFLKGNYENDAALGLSATETTRNAAANELYGKSFMDLSEAQKQLTLLKMVEDANKLSGALGQAQRESDTWTNQLGNMKQALTDLKAAAGSTFLKPAVSVLKILTALLQGATKAVKSLTEENGFLTKTTERYHALVKRLQPAVERMTNSLSRGLSKGADVAKNVVNRLGGIENVMKILSIAAIAFLAVMNWSKIVGGAKLFLSLISNIGKLFSVANLKILGVVAVITLLVLIVEDFINFLLGNDSVIGTIFDKLGIGADEARQAIFDAFGKVKSFLAGVWSVISTGAQFLLSSVVKFFRENKDSILAVAKALLGALTAVWNALVSAGIAIFNMLSTAIKTVFGWIQTFWNSWGSQILSWFQTLWNAAGNILLGFLKIVEGIANFISAVFTGNWSGAWEAIKQIFSGVWTVITNLLQAGWETIKLLFSMGLAAIKAVWETIWGAISSFFQTIWNGITSFISGVLNTIWTTITTIFTNIWNSITTTVANIKDPIVNGFNAAIEFIKSLPEQAIQWGKDFINGLINGIKSGIEGIGNAVKGVGNKIKSFLHFSVPDEGPLTDYESWMPDFMKGMAKGIGDNEGVVLNKVKKLANGLSVLIKGSIANPSTVGSSTVNNSSSSIVQNVNIDNTYNGGPAETQRNVSKAMKKSAVDATTQMARGLAYARG